MTGWIGTPDQLFTFLVGRGADRDREGCFLLGGMIVVGLGAMDLVVAGDAVYFVGGDPRPLAHDLGETCLGLPVVVL